MRSEDVQSKTESMYGITPGEMTLISSRPYTPAQRTKLVSDILNHQQELKKEITHDEWDELHKEITHASDEELDQWWEHVGEWVLSRRDIPHDDPITSEIARECDLSEGEAIVTHQLFKRFSDTTAADYGFLTPGVYRHDTDK